MELTERQKAFAGALLEEMRGARAREAADRAARVVPSWPDGGSPGGPVPSLDEWSGRVRRTAVERLAYYRSHGLTGCDDYPGGDSRFEADVLSGAFHDEYGVMADAPKEDAYIVRKLLDGTFLLDFKFLEYGDNLVVQRTAESVLKRVRPDRILVQR